MSQQVNVRAWQKLAVSRFFGFALSQQLVSFWQTWCVCSDTKKSNSWLFSSVACTTIQIQLLYLVRKSKMNQVLPRDCNKEGCLIQEGQGRTVCILHILLKIIFIYIFIYILYFVLIKRWCSNFSHTYSKHFFHLISAGCHLFRE